MKTLGKIFAFVLVLATWNAFAWKTKGLDNDFQKVLADSQLCESGDKLVGQSDLGTLCVLARDYSEARKVVVEQEALDARRSPPLPPRDTTVSFDWDLSPYYQIAQAWPLISKLNLSSERNSIVKDWDQFFLNFVADYKQKIRYPDVGCFHYSSQKIEGPY